jgi:hypothetical protein
MLFKTLDALREKPKPVRDQYALLFAITFTFIIGGVWSLSLPSRLESVGTASAGAASTTLPFGGMWAELKSKFVQKPSLTAEMSTLSSTTDSVTPTQALDLELRQENIDNLRPSTSSVTAPPVMVLIATSTASTSAE